jgi:N-acetylneuraminic acid mutarotase
MRENMSEPIMTMSELQKALCSALVIALSLLHFACSDRQGPVQARFDSHWSRRIPITVGLVAAGHELEGYQIKLSLNKENFDFAHAQSHGEDIRITSEDGIKLIDHWIEFWDGAGESAAVWVRVPRISNLNSNLIYLYFGNPAAVETGNAAATFEFFDDFNEVYSGATGWTIKPPMPDFRSADIAAAVWDNKLFVFGGYDRDPSINCDFIFLNKTFAFDPATDIWTRKADMPTPRWGEVSVQCLGLIHVFGGKTANQANTVHEIYDPVRDIWSTGPDIPASLADQGISGVRFGEKIHLFYGYAHYEYDPVSQIYKLRANIPTPRKWATTAAVNGKIYLIGGASGVAERGVTNANEAYDPITDRWETKAPLPIAAFGGTDKNPVINGKIYVTHGQTKDKTFLTSCYVYDPATDRWEQMSSGLNPRDGVGCGVINDKLYVVGGRDLIVCAVGRDYMEEYDPRADQGGGKNPWFFSDTSVIKRDMMAAYGDGHGLLFDESGYGAQQNAQHLQELPTCAIDFCWQITDFYGLAYAQPQGVISISNSIGNGSLFFLNNNGRPEFNWYSGAFTPLKEAVWNKWYKVTMIWNGAGSKVIIDGSEYPVTAAAIHSDRIYLRVNNKTRQYFDRFRIRQYVYPEPTVSIGPLEIR